MSSQKIGSSGYIYILDSSGVIQYHPSEELIREDISQNEFVQLQMSLKEQYIQYDWKNPGESQARAKALYMKHFKPWDWVISASSYREEFTELIQVRDFEDELNKLTFGETGYSFIMQGDGTSLVHPYSKGKRLQDVGYGNGEALYQDIIKTKNGIFTYLWRNSADEKEREKIAVVKYFPEYDWYLASSGYIEELYDPVNSVKNILITGFAILIITGIFLTGFISKTIYKPVIDLVAYVEKASEGNMDVLLEWDRKDELGILGDSFDQFMRALKKYKNETEVLILEKEYALKQVRAVKKNLELIVDKRTEELHKSIDQLKKTQDQLLATEKLSTAGQVVTGMAHRLNTPLGTAITMISFLSKELEKNLKLYEEDKLSEEDLYTALQSTETGMKMMEKNLMKSAELIEVMKSIAGMGRRSDAKEFNLKEVIDDCLSLHPKKISEGKIEINVICDPDLMIVNSRSALMQVFNNLITNAFKHGFKGREQGCINITVQEKEEEIDILFTDDGLGIEAEYLNYVFNPFGRLDTIAKGVGLGLYIVHTAVVNGLNGSVNCNSSLGHGTRFEIKVPRENF